jgi:hypothetical protein
MSILASYLYVVGAVFVYLCCRHGELADEIPEGWAVGMSVFWPLAFPLLVFMIIRGDV